MVHVVFRALVKRCIPAVVAMDRLRAHGQVLLTFDDGPDPEHTPRVLDVLDSFGARGLFFVPGLRIPRAPHLLREIVDRGHALGNHGYSHRPLPTLRWADLVADIETGRRAIFDETGIRTRFLRPPFGATNGPVLAATWHTGHRLMLWSADTMEYGRHRQATAAMMASHLLSYRLDRAIVLSHDDHPVIPDVLRQVLPALRAANLDVAGAVGALPWHLGARSTSTVVEAGDVRDRISA
jgi:peptidoglycan/xylan/chitin deacetylase (PgdA/CDA1 family)